MQSNRVPRDCYPAPQPWRIHSQPMPARTVGAGSQLIPVIYAGSAEGLRLAIALYEAVTRQDMRVEEFLKRATALHTLDAEVRYEEPPADFDSAGNWIGAVAHENGWTA